MAAALGNQYARKAKIWEQALKRALARVSNESVDAGLDMLADKVVQSALNGDQWAMKEIGDRIDGKPAQTQILAGDENGGPVRTVSAIERRIVDPQHSDS